MQSARDFLRRIIDYAGLFPPAALEMERAVDAYDSYLKGPDRDLLGRFVIPIGKLKEFDEVVHGRIAGEPWCLSMIAAGDADEARTAAIEFNQSQRAGFKACIDSIEIAASTFDQIASAAALAPDFKTFIEIPLTPDPQPLIAAIAATKACAKMRTGGVVAGAFPAAKDVLNFIELCHEAGVAFKATAGLHHLVKGEYPLTYETGSPRAVMYGYLNVFAAAAFTMQYDGEQLEVINEREASEFRFDSDGLTWRGHRVDKDKLAMVRDYLALSFGSCSFDEPVFEAKEQGIF